MNPEAVPNSPNIAVTPLEFRDIGDQPALFHDFLYADAAEIRRFWPNRDLSLRDFAARVVSDYQTNRKSLCDALLTENEIYGGGPETFRNIERLRQPDCVAVVTGQQAGLFSGPAYAVYKALSTVKLAAALRESGINAVPVFWIASEDHDFDEISVAHFRNVNHILDSVRMHQNKAYDGFPVGSIPVGPEIEEILGEFFNEIEPSGFTHLLRDEISRAYTENADFSTAFGRLMTSWMGSHGLVFTNPLNPVIRELSAPIFAKAATSQDSIRSGLIKANEELINAGFHVQVEVNDDYLPLFHIADKGRRSALGQSGGMVRSKDGLFECPVGALAERVAENPGSFSPNALFRPVVQDFVFPTVCYVGGAAEIAYFAQNVAIYTALGRPVTPIRHRASFTILEARHRRTLEAYDLTVADLWCGYEAVVERVVTARADSNTKQMLKETRETINRQLQGLRETLSGLDPGLADNFEKRNKKILWHIDAMSRKFILFEERRNADLVRRLKDLFDTGFPKAAPQERTICFADHLNQHGPRLIDWLYSHIDESGHQHRIVIF